MIEERTDLPQNTECTFHYDRNARQMILTYKIGGNQFLEIYNVEYDRVTKELDYVKIEDKNTRQKRDPDAAHDQRVIDTVQTAIDIFEKHGLTRSESASILYEMYANNLVIVSQTGI